MPVEQLRGAVATAEQGQDAERSPATAPVGERRRATVTRAVKVWTDQLVDLSGRNQLLYYRTLKRGTLELDEASAPSVAALLSEMPVRLSQLFGGGGAGGGGGGAAVEDALVRARTIHARARTHFEERGIETLFLALGLATWQPTSSSATPAAPVLLRPVRLVPRGAARADFDVRVHGDWQLNETLLHLLRTEFAAELDTDELMAEFDTTADGDIDPSALYDRLRAAAAQVPAFDVRDRTIIGTFAYTKLPMVADLRDNIDRLAAHDLIAAVAGSDGAQQALRELKAVEVDPARPNRTAPRDEFLILDADASQHAAINAALDGQPLIIQGPPGTGKSQTIANLIASLAANGRRVLFVAEKRAAIEAVTSRLSGAGLGDLVMDLHGGVTSRQHLADQLGATLDRIGQVPAPDHTELHHDLQTSRTALTLHSVAMHETRPPWDISVFAIDERLLALPDEVRTPLRFTGAQLTALDAETARQARDALTEWAGLSAPLICQESAWTGAVVPTRADARAALELVTTLAHTAAPEAIAHLDGILADTDLPTPPTVDAWRHPLEVLQGFAETARCFDAGVFDLDLDEIIGSLHPTLAPWPRRTVSAMFNRRFRDARQALLDLWKGAPRPTPRDLRAAAVAAREQLAQWRQLGGTGSPTPPFDLANAITAYDTLRTQLDELGVHMGRRQLTVRPHSKLADDLDALLADQIMLFRLPRVFELEAWLNERHLTRLLRSIADGEIDGQFAGAVFDHAWLQSIRTTLTAQDPRLSDFDAALHHDHAQRFRDSDRRHIAATASRVRRAVAEHATRIRDRHGDQDDLITRQVRRRRGHLSLRALFEQAPDVLTALRPCWAMSPLVVSQTLPSTQLFDVVIFDEASQVLPADAVPALLRAPQVVIAGDRRQLPPTTFFDTGVDEDDEPDDFDPGGLTVGFESILDVLDTVLRSYLLTWHYRSQAEPLIAFANHHTYDGQLITFPGASGGDRLRHELVQQRPGASTDTRSNDVEIRRVVDLMFAHARTRPTESLGVIALGRYHADRVEAALRERLAAEGDRELERFFDDARDERAFVKNLERVQGDERDAIILTIGYGKGADGALRYRFGPLMSEGGDRRLNVAMTRARRRMTVVSSFAHADMHAGRSAAAGVTMLRRYLRYVEAGGRELERAATAEPAGALASDIAEHLAHVGLPVTAGYGSSALRIDVAIAHPDDPERMVLAVETDGAAYRASATTRDRDRLRPEALERLGWRHHRVWSTEWSADPVDRAHRIAMAYDEACRELDAPTVTGVPVDHHDGRHDPGIGAGSDGGDVSPADRSPSVTPVRHGRRPVVRAGTPITQYTQQELTELVRWITSDTLLRTEDQLIDEMMRELGYQRRGPRIVEALTAAIRAA